MAKRTRVQTMSALRMKANCWTVSSWMESTMSGTEMVSSLRVLLMTVRYSGVMKWGRNLKESVKMVHLMD